MAQQYQPAYYHPPAPRGNGFGVTALVLGIIGVVISIIPILGFAAFVLGPLAVIFGIVGVAQMGRPKGMAISGLVLGVVSIIIAAIVTSVFFGALSSEIEGSGRGVDATARSQEPNAVEAVPAEAAPAEASPEVLLIEAVQLLEDFDGNEAAADAKYAGKILEVTGSVNKVDTEFLDDTKYVVRLDDGGEYSFATVNCNDIPTEQAAAVAVGSTVTIRGAFDDGGDLGIELKDCVVL